MAGNAKNLKYPTLEDFAANEVGISGKIEVIWQPLYDWNLYPTAGLASLTFFGTPQNAGQTAQPVAAAAVKSFADTNLKQAGVLSSPQAFWVDNIEIACDAGSVSTANLFALQIPGVFAAAAASTVQAGAHDVNAMLSGGIAQFNIMQKTYYQEGPLYRFPPRSHLHLDTAICSTSATVGQSVKEKLYAEGKGVELDPGFGIGTNMAFDFTVTWPALITTPSGFNGRLGAFLNGWLFRAAQ